MTTQLFIDPNKYPHYWQDTIAYLSKRDEQLAGLISADELFIGWHENGQKKWEVNFKNGKQDGLGT